jgi:hypothetical protein
MTSQTAKRFGITLPDITALPRAESVDRFQLDDGTEEFQLVFADGTRSALLRADELDDYSKCLAERPPSTRARQRPRRKSISQGSAKRRNAVKRDKRTASKSKALAQSDTPSGKPQGTLAPFGTKSAAEQLLESIDAEYERALHDDQANVDAFPAFPSDDRIRRSLQTFRQLISEPAVSLLVCAVCAERHFVGRFRTFSLASVYSPPATPLPDAMLNAMKAKLVHDPSMPSHLPQLTGGLQLRFVFAFAYPRFYRPGCAEWFGFGRRRT